MRRFADLFLALDRTTSSNEKVAAMAAFFGDHRGGDAAWVLYFLAGHKLRRVLSGRRLAHWAAEASAVPDWLFRECYATVGDLAETITLILDRGEQPASAEQDVPLSEWVENRLASLRGLPEAEQQALVLGWLRVIPREQRFLLIKLLTGEMRVGISHSSVVKALALAAGAPREIMAARLAGDWKPTAEFLRSLLSGESSGDEASRPYPFFLASPIEEAGGPVALGAAEVLADWQWEWKWDGIRAQLIRREGRTWLWSRGNELLTEKFPEIADAAARLPDGLVLDGEVICWSGGAPLPFSKLQTRIGRTTLSRRVLTSAPAAFIAYDLLEQDRSDLRALSLAARRERLEAVVSKLGSGKIVLSQRVEVADWNHAAQMQARSRERGVEGLMLKRLSSPYGSGRTRGDWWKWKVAPFTFDGVLVYAEPGHGRRANLLTDYTFAVWKSGALAPVARAYSGLTDVEIVELDRWIRHHTVSRFGPARHVEPVRVYELAFEGIALSSRHKGGVAMRFPRIIRRREDKSASEADTIERLLGLIGPGAGLEPTLFG